MAEVDWEHEAVRTGNWDDPRTWRNRSVPSEDSNVRIGRNVTVRLGQQNNVNMGRVLVEGNLIFRPNVNTRSITDTRMVAPGGRLEIGNAVTPVASGITAEVIFRDSSRVPVGGDRSNLGLMGSGDISICGADKVSRKRLLRDANAGSRNLRLSGRASDGWKANDEV